MRIEGNYPKRQTPAYEVMIGRTTLFFSYRTLIGVRGPQGYRRRDNVWGPTTGRHINEFGYRDAPIMDEDELRDYAIMSMYEDILSNVPALMNIKETA